MKNNAKSRLQPCLHLLRALGLWAACTVPLVAAAQVQAAEAAASAATSAAAAKTAPQLGFSDGVVRVFGTPAGQAMLVGTHLDPVRMAGGLDAIEPEFKEESGPRAVFDTAKAFELQPGAATRTWAVPYRVEGLTSQGQWTRYASVQVNGQVHRIGYLLTNLPAKSVEMTLTLARRWETAEGPLEIVVQAGAQAPLTGVHIVQVDLSEKTLGYTIGAEALELCKAATGTCEVLDPIAPSGMAKAYLRLGRNATLRPGLYTGTLSLGADGRAEPKTASLEIAASSSRLQVLGALAVLLGTVAAFFVTTYSRLQLAYLTALRPAAILRDKLQAYQRRIGDFERAIGLAPPSSLQVLREALWDSCQSLADGRLRNEHLLPSRWQAFGAFDAAPLAQRLREVEQLLRSCAIVVRQGFDPVEGLLLETPAGLRDEALALAQKAAEKFDALGADLSHEDRVRASVQAAVDAMKEAVDAMKKGLAAGGSNPSVVVPASLSSQQITERIDAFNFTGWMAWLALTGLSGCAVVVLLRPGFGTWLDFIYCIFWGFGLPTATERLQQTTPSSIAGNLTITVPQ